MPKHIESNLAEEEDIQPEGNGDFEEGLKKIADLPEVLDKEESLEEDTKSSLSKKEKQKEKDRKIFHKVLPDRVDETDRLIASIGHREKGDGSFYSEGAISKLIIETNRCIGEYRKDLEEIIEKADTEVDEKMENYKTNQDGDAFIYGLEKTWISLEAGVVDYKHHSESLMRDAVTEFSDDKEGREEVARVEGAVREAQAAYNEVLTKNIERIKAKTQKYVDKIILQWKKESLPVKEELANLDLEEAKQDYNIGDKKKSWWKSVAKKERKEQVEARRIANREAFEEQIQEYEDRFAKVPKLLALIARVQSFQSIFK